MSVTMIITAVCNTAGCGKEFTVSGENVSKRSLKIGARKAGWLVKGRATQLCPDHRPSAVKAAAPKKVKAPKASKKVSKKVTAKPASKKATNGSGKPVTPAGQSIGKLARSAKVSPAPAAE